MLTAIEYLRSGLCVLPAIPAEKRPALAGWKQYQRRLPTEQQVQTWFADAPAMCILAGAVSGHLEMIDFDHEGELFDRWRDLVATELPALVERLVVERSQSGGRHVIIAASRRSQATASWRNAPWSSRTPIQSRSLANATCHDGLATDLKLLAR